MVAVCAHTFGPYPFVQTALESTMLVIFFGLHCIAWPYDTSILNWLDALGLLTLIISLQCTLIFWRYQKVDEENAFVKNSVTYTAQATMYITTLGLLVAFILTVVHSKVSEILAKIKKKKAKKRAKKDRKEARLQASGRLSLRLTGGNWYEQENICVGDEVKHPLRGDGVVVQVICDKASKGRVVVTFGGKDGKKANTHRYGKASWGKFERIVTNPQINAKSLGGAEQSSEDDEMFMTNNPSLKKAGSPGSAARNNDVVAVTINPACRHSASPDRASQRETRLKERQSSFALASARFAKKNETEREARHRGAAVGKVRRKEARRKVRQGGSTEEEGAPAAESPGRPPRPVSRKEARREANRLSSGDGTARIATPRAVAPPLPTAAKSDVVGSTEEEDGPAAESPGRPPRPVSRKEARRKANRLSRGEGTARIASPRAVAPPLPTAAKSDVETLKDLEANKALALGTKQKRRQTAAALEVAAAGEASDEYSSAY